MSQEEEKTTEPIKSEPVAEIVGSAFSFDFEEEPQEEVEEEETENTELEADEEAQVDEEETEQKEGSDIEEDVDDSDLESESESEEEEEEGDPIEENWPTLAENYKQKGYLPEDFEITEDITDEDIEEGVVQNYLSHAEKEAIQRGYTEEDLHTSRLLNQGVDPELLSEAGVYSRLAEVDVEGSDDNKVQRRRELLSRYYQARGNDEEEVRMMVDKAFEEDNDEKFAKKAKEFFGQKAQQIKEREEERIQEQERKRQKQKKRNRRKMNELLDKGVINGREYDDSEMEYVRNALYEPTEVIEDEDGNKRRVSRYEIIKRERQNDFEYLAQQIVDMILNYDNAEHRDEEKRRSKNRKRLKSMNNVIKKDKERETSSAESSPDERGIVSRELDSPLLSRQ